MRLFLLICAVVFPCAATTAQSISQHPVIERLTTEGFSVDDGQRAWLTKPLVTPDMPADAQRQAFSDLVGSRRLEKYLQNSVVAPFKLKIETVRKTADNSAVRSLDLYFVVRGDLKIINEKELLSGMMGDSEKAKEHLADSGFETYAETIDGAASNEVPPKGTILSSLYRYRFPIMDKVVVSGLVRGEGLYVDGALMQSAVTPQDKLNDPMNPTQWLPVPRGAKTDLELGAAQPFLGFQCYMTATQLAFTAKPSVLVECHAAYVEPHGWFDGRNLLASKLPLVMQQNVRDFRRNLKEAQAK